MNLRTELAFEAGYHTINREERNLAAIFYHTLLINDNLKKFLTAIGSTHIPKDDEIAIYFEYAYIRDLWNWIALNRKGDVNQFKKELIIKLLNPNNKEELEAMSTEQFNTYFGAVPTPSKTEIQSPSNWSIKKYNSNISDNDEFLKVTKFKWCFNAKPDIVIHTCNNTAICIEAKNESGEGQYPGSAEEKAIFRDRGLALVGQLSIQKKILEELLGIKTEFVFLVNKKSLSETHKTLTWVEAFSNLDTSNAPNFIKQWVARMN